MQIKKDIVYKCYKITITWPGNNTEESPINYEVFNSDSDIPVLGQGDHGGSLRSNLKEIVRIVDSAEIDERINKLIEKLSKDKGYEYHG